MMTQISIPPLIRRALPLILMIAILWLAMGARFYNLGAQSLWYDEGVAYGHSQRTLFEMIPRLQNNVHVPAYFGTLALYENVVGATEFGLRSYSALWSVLSVAAAYALGKRLFHPIAGLSAAVFVAFNSFSVYYAQETRMYAMLAAIATLSIWAFAGWSLRALTVTDDRPDTATLWKWGIAFGVLNIIGEYTHVSYALVMLTQGVMATLLLLNLALRAVVARLSWRTVGRITLIYITINLMSLLAFAPWLMTALSQISAQPNISEPIGLPAMIRIVQGWFAFGRTFEEGMAGLEVVVYFLMLFGLLRLTDDRRTAWWRLALPVVWVLLSTGLYLYLELYARYLRFLLPAQIAYALWMGRGAWVLWEIIPRNLERRTGWQRTVTQYLPKVAATVAVLAFAYQQMVLLQPLYHDDAYQRDDYRTLAATIADEAREGDAIILSAPGLQEIFAYYNESMLPIYTLPASEDIAADTEAILRDHQRVYAVLYGQAEQDPDGQVVATLNTVGFPLGGQWVGDVRLERFAAPANFPAAEPINITFGDTITLESVALNHTTLRPTDVLQVQLQWVTTQPLTTRYKVFVQLIDSDGLLAGQHDSEPAGGLAPTTQWQAGDRILDNHALTVADLPAGSYRLIVGVYPQDDPALEARLQVNGESFYPIGEVVVE